MLDGFEWEEGWMDVWIDEWMDGWTDQIGMGGVVYDGREENSNLRNEMKRVQKKKKDKEK